MTQSLPIFGPPVRGRSCGGCQFCCTTVPVVLPDEHKPANVRCKHLCAKGCSIYARRPDPCRAWSCRWLFDADTAGMRRPDHAGYAIDPMLDTLLIDGKPVDALQIWCDPKRPDAHRDPSLRAYLDHIGKKHMLLSLVRWSSVHAMVLFPPSLASDGQWHERESGMHSVEDMAARLSAVDALPPWRKQRLTALPSEETQ